MALCEIPLHAALGLDDDIDIDSPFTIMSLNVDDFEEALKPAPESDNTSMSSNSDQGQQYMLDQGEQDGLTKSKLEKLQQ